LADVFVGFYYDEKKAEDLMCISRRGLSAAANGYQKGFLSGLTEDMRVLTVIPMGTYPTASRQAFFKKETKTTEEGTITYLPFVNCYVVRECMLQFGLYRELSQIICRQPHTTVYVYSLNVLFEKVLARLKRKYGDKFHYCLIIPDLPGSYGIVRQGIRGIKDKLEAAPKMKLASFADSYVFLTDAMKKLFPVKPYAVIEGFLPAETFDYSLQRIPKTILYAGTLNEAFGILTLLEAFSQIGDADYRLWICGSGDAEQKVRQAAQKDPRIIYKGFLSKNEVAKLQTQCDVLINPRPDNGEYTKYSFPSKTMEYLLSGSKVLMYRLPGIPEEYYQFVRTIQGVSSAAIAEAIVSTCEDNNFYNSRWQEQVRWIADSKSAVQQTKKLQELSVQQKQ
jgi:glycosyltransferase involved in cell wall biosynthesis